MQVETYRTSLFELMSTTVSKIYCRLLTTHEFFGNLAKSVGCECFSIKPRTFNASYQEGSQEELIKKKIANTMTLLDLCKKHQRSVTADLANLLQNLREKELMNELDTSQSYSGPCLGTYQSNNCVEKR